MDTQEKFTWSSFGITDPGKKRRYNEDSMLEHQEIGLWVVADGMGGHTAGDIASQAVVSYIEKIRKDANLGHCVDNIEDRLLEANLLLKDEARKKGKNITIGSTVVGMLVYDCFCIIFWVGDSRLYRLRNKALQQLTTDHSQIEVYIERGILTRQEAAFHPGGNIITRAIGTSKNLYVDFDIRKMQAGDRYMLCSDGLTKHIRNSEFEEMLSRGTAEEACKFLIERTLERGAGDNVTVIVIDIKSVN